MSASNFTTYVLVFDIKNDKLLEKGVGSITFNAIKGEKYAIFANSESASETGSYTLSLSNTTPSSNTISGSLDQFDVQADDGAYLDGYDLIATRSGSARVSINSSITGFRVAVFDEDGEIVSINEQEFNVFLGESFFMLVFGDPYETGSYELTLENLEQD